MPICSVPQCGLAVKRIGMCSKHETRVRRYGDPSVNKRPELSMSFAERFWMKVDKNGPIPGFRPDLGPCWTWHAYIDAGGYGHFQVGKLSRYAHVVAFELVTGLTKGPGDLDHLCRVRHCVNPAHLEPATRQTNVLRGIGIAAEESKRTHCPAGHPYDEANTRHHSGRRYCRACGKARYTKKGAPPLKTHCPYGHAFTPENTYAIGTARNCRECGRRRSREWQRAGHS